MMQNPVKIRIIRPSSREQGDLLAERRDELAAVGFEILYDDLPSDPTWPYASATAADRARALTDALLEPGTAAVVCARGGYGASDLLPLIPWAKLKKAPPKLLCGFSDVSALHWALDAQLGWPSVHGPMPATVLWRKKEASDADVEQLLSLLRDVTAGRGLAGEIALEPLNGAPAATGELLGGCFTVITNLIGTPYFPRSLAGKILYFEDTDEHPARLVRAFNQWAQAGLLDQAAGVVFGHFRNLGDKIEDCAPFVYERLAERTRIPAYKTKAFGHTAPNFPLVNGAAARVERGSLVWTLERNLA